MKLGRYEIIGQIAKGGMAEIYRARLSGPAGFEQTFAVKRILPRHCDNDDFRRMFVNEAKVASFLRHPNIVSVLELGEEDGSLFLVMEYVKGTDLHRLLTKMKKAGQTLSPDLTAYVIASLLKALAYAHSKTDDQGRPLGIVHRDVTPHNTLITEEGQIKLADFGIAKAAFTTFQTAQGLTRGKLGYMSPEQIRGQRLSGASDLFTVGIMMLELLTGTLRTAAGSPKALIKETIQGRLALDPRLKEAPAALGELCKKLLAMTPDHRPTAAEAVAALAASGWDRDKSREMAALVARYAPAPATQKTSAQEEPESDKTDIQPPPVHREVEPGAKQGPAHPVEIVDAEQKAPSRPETKPSGNQPPPVPSGPPKTLDHHPNLEQREAQPQQAMEEMPTVILDDQPRPDVVKPTPGSAGPLPPPPAPPTPSPHSGRPERPMEGRPTVILSETIDEMLARHQAGMDHSPAGADAQTAEGNLAQQPPGPPAPSGLAAWRLGLRAILLAATLVLGIWAIVQINNEADRGSDSSGGIATTGGFPLPKGRILLVGPARVQVTKSARLSLDGILVPEGATILAVPAGPHRVEWIVDGRSCGKRNITVSPGSRYRLEMVASCPDSAKPIPAEKPGEQRSP